MNNYEDYKIECGKRIKEARKEKGYTQVELAKKIGVFQVQIADWENGKRKPQESHMQALSKVLEISETSLNLGKGEITSKDTKYGKEITIKHIFNGSPTHISPKHKQLSNDNMHIVNELIETLSEE